MPAIARPERPRTQKHHKNPKKITHNNSDPQKNTIGCAPQLDCSAGKI